MAFWPLRRKGGRNPVGTEEKLKRARGSVGNGLNLRNSATRLTVFENMGRGEIAEIIQPANFSDPQTQRSHGLLSMNPYYPKQRFQRQHLRYIEFY